MNNYKRLTKYNEYTHNAEVYAYSINKDIYFDGVDIVGNENSNLAQETIDKLAEYEDKIENGTLIELPCKVGDIVYYFLEENDNIYLDEGKVVSFSIDETDLWLYAKYTSGLTYWHTASELGDRLFLTKEQAEAKLKELQSKE